MVLFYIFQLEADLRDQESTPFFTLWLIPILSNCEEMLLMRIQWEEGFNFLKIPRIVCCTIVSNYDLR